MCTLYVAVYLDAGIYFALDVECIEYRMVEGRYAQKPAEVRDCSIIHTVRRTGTVEMEVFGFIVALAMYQVSTPSASKLEITTVANRFSYYDVLSYRIESCHTPHHPYSTIPIHLSLILAQYLLGTIQEHTAFGSPRS